jgi:hypothetical protein
MVDADPSVRLKPRVGGSNFGSGRPMLDLFDVERRLPGFSQAAYFIESL